MVAKEQIAGYDVIDCADLDEAIDEAIEVASKHPTAWYGTIEVRPIAATTTRTPRRPADRQTMSNRLIPLYRAMS